MSLIRANEVLDLLKEDDEDLNESVAPNSEDEEEDFEQDEIECEEE